MNKARFFACLLAIIIAGTSVATWAAPQSNRKYNTTVKPKSASTLEVSPSSVNFDQEGGTGVFRVTCDGSWSVSGNVSWGDIEHKKGSNIIRFFAQPNNETTSRSGYFYVIAGNMTRRIDVTQDPREEPRIEVATSVINFDNYTGAKTIEVTSNRNWKVSEPSNDWFSVIPDGNVVQVNVQRNESTRARKGSFKVFADNKSVDVTVKQNGYEPYFSPSPLSLSFDEIGGTLTVSVESESDEWTYDGSSTPWISISKVGNKLNVYASPNDSEYSRDSHITVGFPGGLEKQVSVHQPGMSSSKKKKSTYYDDNNYDKSYSSSSGGSRFRVGIELLGEINTNYLFKGSDDDPATVYGYGGGLIFDIGRYTDILNFSFGAKFMQFRCKSDYGSGLIGNYIVVPANLKINTFRMGSSKFYLGGGYEYGFPLKDAVKFMDWNAGIGINSRHVDWYIFFKQFFGDDGEVIFTGDYKNHIGTSLTFYF